MIKNKIIFHATDDLLGLRLDKALSSREEIRSRSRAEQLILSGDVKVNNKLERSSYKIKKNDYIEYFISTDKKEVGILPLNLPLDILFEDDDLIVLNKPAGLVVHPSAGHENDTLVNALLFHTKNLSMKFGENRPGIVHRIDRETSGLLVVAKNDFCHENLALQFKQKTIHRIYYALAIGTTKNKIGKIQSYLSRHPLDRKRYASVRDAEKKIITQFSEDITDGKWSVTNYAVLKEHPSKLSYVRLQLETGRTHQIRVHLSELGIPIAGDRVYGADKKIKNITSNELRKLISDIPRFALHAAELGFKHPKTNENLIFKVDWPADVFELLKKLEFIDV